MKYLLFIFTFSTISLFSQNCIVAHYPFDGDANDVSGNNFHGTVSGAVLTNDRFGRSASAFEFDGVDDVIEIASNSSFNFTTNDDFTISLWFRMNDQTSSSSGNYMMISKFNDNGTNNPDGFPYSVRIFNASHADAGKVHALRRDLKACGNKPEVTSSNTWDDNKFHHVVFIKDGSTLKLYTDNTLEDSGTDITSCQTDNSFKLRIGSKGGSNNSASFFDGDLDDVIIFNCALSENEIDSLFKVTAWVGIDEMSNQNKVTFFPNPSDGELIFDGDVNDILSIQLLSITGEIVFEKSLESNLKSLFIPSLVNNGIYFLRLYKNQGTETHKIIIER